MELTKKERLILINQYEILHALKPHEGYDEKVKILTDGYSALYDGLFEWIDEDVPAEELEFVMAVFDMYRVIGGVFPGYDGNYEGRYLAAARFLVDDQGRWTERKEDYPHNDGMNSHRAMIPKYRNMLAAWDGCKNKHAPTDAELESIQNA